MPVFTWVSSQVMTYILQNNHDHQVFANISFKKLGRKAPATQDINKMTNKMETKQNIADVAKNNKSYLAKLHR